MTVTIELDSAQRAHALSLVDDALESLNYRSAPLRANRTTHASVIDYLDTVRASLVVVRDALRDAT